ncbi:transcriptional regulator, HxlR family [Lentzea fradiae]|uniref:Transcriptional regulator, HxlR family n=1 Tax=Lentzea fradiae TaxID=200378 RepID=A0A1G7L312_9PSEU|nr:transcriptional regulator, HxlR family [Lentzea fradiae]
MVLVVGQARNRRREALLHGNVRPISAEILEETLAAMERMGWCGAAPFSVPRWRGEYGLMPLGRSLVEVVEHARAWARDHLVEWVTCPRNLEEPVRRLVVPRGRAGTSQGTALAQGCLFVAVELADQT